jgi:DNA-binding transcriptional ArsR family regulator
VLRIHFTAEDLGRVRVAADPDPFWETVLSLFRLRHQGPPLIFGGRRRHAVRTSRRADLELLLRLVPGGYYPDFLAADGARGRPGGIGAPPATPASWLRRELDLLAGRGATLPAWMSRLRSDGREILERLTAAIRSHHAAVVAPVWSDVRAHVEADRAKRARAFLDGGCDGLLGSYLPMMRWRSPVLEIDVPFEQTLRLDGRGVLLVPSLLSWRAPDFLPGTSLPPVLVYPVDNDPTRSARQRPGDGSIAALIGVTRTLVLASIGDGRTTSELARRVGVSPALISQHTAVLREAGLIRTSRVGKAVLHTLTPLGAALLA